MRTALLAFTSALLTPAAAASDPPVVGIGEAKDGDSLSVGGREVRLFGIDAPEYDQTCTRDGQQWSCGTAAANELAKLVTGRQIICLVLGKDEHQRLVGRCLVGGADVNSTMVREGLAVAFRRYSSDYVADEERAKLAKRGLWAGKFQMPADYRRGGEARASTSSRRKALNVTSSDWAARAKGNCNIKGNRNRRGEWIYHVPGMPYYEQTKPEELFCTEQQARGAGYRRAIVR